MQPMRGNKINLLGKSKTEISSLLGAAVDVHFRSDQIYSWIYEKKVLSFDKMTNLGKNLRSFLEEGFSLEVPAIVDKLTSDDGTAKYLLSLDNGAQIEVVRMDESDHYTLCISSQAGCSLGCLFCATGISGLERNLNSEEILGSVLVLMQELDSIKPVNIVFMGMGEPLLNYDEVVKSIKILTDTEGMAVPERRITLSTVGIPGKIKALKEAFPRLGIAVSVNAYSDSLRSELMPVNKTYPLSGIIRELSSLGRGAEKWLTLEYVLISGINDAQKEARGLAAMAKSLRAKVNIIPLNQVEGFDGRSPSDKTIDSFVGILSDARINVTVRRSKGRRLGAACGQLRAEGRH